MTNLTFFTDELLPKILPISLCLVFIMEPGSFHSIDNQTILDQIKARLGVSDSVGEILSNSFFILKKLDDSESKEVAKMKKEASQFIKDYLYPKFNEERIICTNAKSALSSLNQCNFLGIIFRVCIK
jgi:hypothetical protein